MHRVFSNWPCPERFVCSPVSHLIAYRIWYFVFTDIEFINNVNTSAVKISDENTINVRKITFLIVSPHTRSPHANWLKLNDNNYLNVNVKFEYSKTVCNLCILSAFFQIYAHQLTI